MFSWYRYKNVKISSIINLMNNKFWHGLIAADTNIFFTCCRLISAIQDDAKSNFDCIFILGTLEMSV